MLGMQRNLSKLLRSWHCLKTSMANRDKRPRDVKG